MSPSLAGGFFTTKPSGKPLIKSTWILFEIWWSDNSYHLKGFHEALKLIPYCWEVWWLFILYIFALALKKDREVFWHRPHKGDRVCPVTSLSKGAIYFFTWLLTVNQRYIWATGIQRWEGTMWDGVAREDYMPNGENGPSFVFSVFQIFGHLSVSWALPLC